MAEGVNVVRAALIAGIGLTLGLGFTPEADGAQQGRPSARFCAGEAGQGRYPPGCPGAAARSSPDNPTRRRPHQRRMERPWRAPNLADRPAVLRDFSSIAEVVSQNYLCFGYNMGANSCQSVITSIPSSSEDGLILAEYTNPFLP